MTGLHIPSEPTFKKMWCLMALTEESLEALMKRTATDKKSSLETLKSHWHADNRRHSRPEPMRMQLPNSPMAFREQYPAEWEKIYAGGRGPVNPRIDEFRVNLLNGSFKCRNNTAEASKTAIVQVDPSSPSSDTPPMGGFEAAIQSMGTMMIRGMQQMCEQQNEMMKLMMGSPEPRQGLEDASPRFLDLLDRASPRLGIRKRAIGDIPSQGVSERLAAANAAEEAAKLAAIEEAKWKAKLEAEKKAEEAKATALALVAPGGAASGEAAAPAPVVAREAASGEAAIIAVGPEPLPSSAAALAGEGTAKKAADLAAKMLDDLTSREEKKAAAKKEAAKKAAAEKALAKAAAGETAPKAAAKKSHHKKKAVEPAPKAEAMAAAGEAAPKRVRLTGKQPPKS